jgi:proteic killer suppression protein
VIKSFRHKGLKKFYETGSAAGIQSTHKSRVRMILIALETSLEIEDMDIPGLKLHALKGKLKERFAVSVSGNWRITFEFRDGNAYILDYEDYH